MSSQYVFLELREWEQLTPADTPALKGLFFREQGTRNVAKSLSQRGIIDVTELREGISISSNSFVGRVQLEDLQINIRPKLKGMPLNKLLKYAYGLRDLQLFSNAQHNLDSSPLFDILIHQLYTEVEELYNRSLSKSYISRSEELESPRGRIDIKKLSERGAAQKASLPCRYFERSEDTLLNRVLLAGLALGMKLAEDRKLKIQLYRLSARMHESIELIPLNRQILQRSWSLNRMTTRYRPALELINILYESQGIQLEDGRNRVQLQGFFFDMNSFFETLVSRLIRDYCKEYTLRDQYNLHEMFAYAPEYNPKRRRSPTPRPDFALMKQGKVVKLLDAKYRDLWEKALPSGMLYQLAVYAVSGIGDRTATILYPSMEGGAVMQSIDIKDTVTDAKMASVVLKPVNLERVALLLGDRKSVV